MLSGSVPCNKGAGDVVAACVAVVVDQFAAEIKTPRQFAFHRLRIDFLGGDAPASDKGFIQRMRAVHFEGEIFAEVGESFDFLRRQFLQRFLRVDSGLVAAEQANNAPASGLSSRF